MYMWLCVRIHAYTNKCTYIYIYTDTMYMWLCVRIYVYTIKCTYTYVYIYIYMYIYVHIYIPLLHVWHVFQDSPQK